MEREIRTVTALLLWKHEAIQVSAEKPFRLSSGNFTPLYVNLRLLISYPSTRDLLIGFARYLYRERQIHADCIAGGETAGIALGAWLAKDLDKPFVYVRKKPKGHGTGTQVEGVAAGEVLLFEDLITDGGSKMGFIEGIRQAGCTISDCLVIVDREQGGDAALARVGVKLHSLVDISTCLQTGLNLGLLTGEQHAAVQGYLTDTAGWHAHRGLAFADAIGQPK